MSLMSKYLALEIAHEAAPLLLYPNPGILTTAALFFATLAESINTGMRFCFFVIRNPDALFIRPVMLYMKT